MYVFGRLTCVMRARVVAELRNVPDYEGVLRNTALHCLQHGVLRLLQPDVVVFDEAAGRGNRLRG